jgi:hypothetical protein
MASCDVASNVREALQAGACGTAAARRHLRLRREVSARPAGVGQRVLGRGHSSAASHVVTARRVSRASKIEYREACLTGSMACIGDRLLSAAACDKAVKLGRVAPPRPDVICVSAGRSALGRALAGVLWAAAIFVLHAT